MADQEWTMWPATNGFNLHQGCETIAEHVPREDIARKMIAAPDLLAALKTARSVLGTLLQSDSGTYINAEQQISAAIAKAEGRA